MAETSIPCRRATRDQIRQLKRGGDSWDDLLEKMAASYDPDADQ